MENLPMPEDQNVSNITPENYDSDIADIENEISAIDDLFNKSLSYMMMVQNSHSKGSLSFTHLQTANLISLKKSKLDAIKARVALKEKRFNQKVKIDALTSKDGGSNEIPAARIIEILSMGGMTFQQMQEVKPEREVQEAEIAELDEYLEQELKDDMKSVSTAANEQPDFKPEEYAEPEVEKTEEGDENLTKGVEEFSFAAKTEMYEVVSDATGKIYVIDLENSTDEGVALLDPGSIGIGPNETAEITSALSGAPIAKFRGVEIEIVEMEG